MATRASSAEATAEAAIVAGRSSTKRWRKGMKILGMSWTVHDDVLIRLRCSCSERGRPRWRGGNGEPARARARCVHASGRLGTKGRRGDGLGCTAGLKAQWHQCSFCSFSLFFSYSIIPHRTFAKYWSHCLHLGKLWGLHYIILDHNVVL